MDLEAEVAGLREINATQRTFLIAAETRNKIVEKENLEFRSYGIGLRVSELLAERGRLDTHIKILKDALTFIRNRAAARDTGSNNIEILNTAERALTETGGKYASKTEETVVEEGIENRSGQLRPRENVRT